MAKSTPQKTLIFGLVGAGLLIGLTVLGGWLYLKLSLDPNLSTFFNAISTASRDAEHRRAEPAPPGLTFEDGDAAVHYKEAWKLTEALEDKDSDALYAAMLKLKGKPYDGKPGGDKPLHTETPPACVAAGAPEGAVDPVIALLPESACTQLTQVAPALKRMKQGSLQKNNRSPLHIWDPWQDNGKRPQFLNFIRLSKYNLLLAHIDGLKGDRDAQLDRIFVSLRVGYDFSSNANLIGTMVGVAINDEANAHLNQLVRSGALSEAQLEQVARHAAYLAQGDGAIRAAFEAEYLWVMSSILDTEEHGFIVPTGFKADALGQPPMAGNAMEQAVLQHTASEHHKMWSTMLPKLGGTMEQRLAAYQESTDMMDRSINPLSQIAGLDYGKYDIRHAASVSSLRIIGLAAACMLHKRRTGALPGALSDLSSLGFTLATTDPLTEKPFVLADGQLKSAFADLPAASKLEPEGLEMLVFKLE